MKYTQIPTNAFQTMQMNAGVLATDFTPATGTLDSSAILGATTGGISISIVPEFADMGEDIDNCPKNTMELKKITDYTVTASGTFITAAAAVAEKLVAAANASTTSGMTTITPSLDLSDDDFGDIWFIGDYSDVNTGANAGFMAVHILNALSTGGFAIQTTDQGKGQFAFEFTGHFSIDAQDTVPAEIYVKAGT